MTLTVWQGKAEDEGEEGGGWDTDEEEEENGASVWFVVGTADVARTIVG